MVQRRVLVTVLSVLALLASVMASGAGARVTWAAQAVPSHRGFPVSVYPSPVRPADGVVLGMAVACPNPDGLLPVSGPTRLQVRRLLTDISSGNLLLMRRASDRALWPSLRRHAPSKATRMHLSTARSARQAPYAQLIRNGCGQLTLARSQWVESCPAACAVSSPALIIHVFLINRAHRWLIWGVTP